MYNLVPMKDISDRNDVYNLVSAFYAKVRRDPDLGPIFNSVIHNWEEHIVHLTNFWESQLFMVNVFQGNPLKKHVEVDKKNDGTITNVHFGIWLRHWLQTLDELFEGERAQIAKNRARNMSIYMFMQIFKSRQDQ